MQNESDAFANDEVVKIVSVIKMDFEAMELSLNQDDVCYFSKNEWIFV